MNTTKKFIAFTGRGEMEAQRLIGASNWTEAMSKAILEASIDQVELTGIELVQEPGVSDLSRREALEAANARALEAHKKRQSSPDKAIIARIMPCEKCGKKFTAFYNDEIWCRTCCGGLQPPAATKEPDVHQQILQELKNVNARLASIQSEHGEFREETRLYRLRA